MRRVGREKGYIEALARRMPAKSPLRHKSVEM